MKKRTKIICISGIIVALVALLGGSLMFILGNRETTVQEEVVKKNKLDIEWYDEEGTEFTISTAEELIQFSELAKYYDFKGQTVKLGADIVVNEGNAEDWEEEMPEHQWESIYGFAGTFDGQGHTISGIFCRGFTYFGIQGMEYRFDHDQIKAGLFRYTLPECVIKNFRLVNSYFVGDLNDGVGSISAYGGGTFESIYSNAKIVSEKRGIGGIMGYATENTTIRNCWFDGTIDVVGDYARYTGGIVGRNRDEKELTVEHCLVSATMNNDLYKKGVNMGGILGLGYGKVTITDSLVSGHLYNDWQIVGSIMGNFEAGTEVTMQNVYATKDAWKQAIGHFGGDTDGLPITYERDRITGIGGYQWTTLDFDKYWAAQEKGTPVLKTFAENPIDLKGQEKLVDVSWYDPDAKTYTIKNSSELFGFALLSYANNFEGKTIKLGADITVNQGKAADWGKKAPEKGWLCIGSNSMPFSGTFDGCMHTVSGVYLYTEDSYNGFFGRTSDKAVVKNFKLTNSYFESKAASFGSIAGRGTGTYDTVYSNAIVVSDNGNVGGLIGQITNGDFLKMNNCWFDGKIIGKGNELASTRRGGLLGFVVTNVTLTNCLNTGTIDVSGFTKIENEKTGLVRPFAGGLIGQVHSKGSAKLSYCMNVGEVKVSSAANAGHSAIVGLASGILTAEHTFVTEECSKNQGSGNVKGKIIAYPKAQLSGIGSYQWTTLDFNKYWAARSGDTAVLRSFAKSKMSLAGAERMIDVSWYNPKADTYVLYDAADLYGFALLSYTNDFAKKTVKLGADITVNTGKAADWENAAPANLWMCIGSNGSPFSGTFDGQMHTISGIYLKTNASWGGLFGRVGDKGLVKNFSLVNSYFESDQPSLGSIAGRGTGTLDTIYSNAIIRSSSGNVGGIVGQVNSGDKLKVNACWFDGNIKTTADTIACSRIGGILGFVLIKAEVTNCLNTGTIDASIYTVPNSATSKHVQPYVGGLIGQIHPNGHVDMADSLNVGKVLYSSKATTSYAATIGTASGTATVTNVYATKESCKKISQGYITGQVIAFSERQLSGTGSYQWTALNFNKYWAAVDKKPAVIKAFAKNSLSLSGVKKLFDTSWYDKKKDTFVLKDSADLYGLSMLASSENFAGKTIKLGADIVANTGDASTWAAAAPDYEWNSVGTLALPFEGTFDGCMHTVSGIYLNADIEDAGFFGNVSEKGTVKNFILKNSYFTNQKNNLGSIAGRGAGKFEKIYSNAIVEASASYVGGFVGRDAGKTLSVSDCWFDGTVINNGNSTSQRFTGGFIGRTFGDTTITRCVNTGTVAAPNYTVKESATDASVRPYMGGFVGFVGSKKTLKISQCLNAKEPDKNEATTTGCGLFLGRIDVSTNVEANAVYTVKSTVNTSASTAHNTAKSNLNSVVVGVEPADINGSAGLSRLVGLFASKKADGTYENNWVVVAKGAPTLKIFADLTDKYMEVDTAWYNPKGTEFVLSNRSELFGLAVLSNMADIKGFSGQTIKLGKDIEVNEKKATDYAWLSIGQTHSFQGAFDGQGHKISGVHLNATAANAGFFGAVNTDQLIQNFMLTDSTFESNQNSLGSIVGEVFKGRFDTIYSNAAMTASGNNTGGLIGRANAGNVTLTNCWFDGTLTNTATTTGFGGLIGKNQNATLTIEHCLNSGAITSEVATQPYVGGLIGNNTNGKKIRIAYTLNSGVVKVNTSVTSKFGSLLGYNSNSSADWLELKNVFATNESCKKGSAAAAVNGGSAPEGAVLFNASAGAGMAAITNASLKQLFTEVIDETTYVNRSYWSVVPKSTPVLTAFADVAREKSLPIDTSWYRKDKDTYELADVGDFYGFAILSNMTEAEGFKNKNIKLTGDILINEGTPAGADGILGTADDWEKKGPEYSFVSIGQSPAFQGGFDGQGHRISGVYISTGKANVGLFGVLNTSLKIQNFKLVNSYIFGQGNSTASIAGEVYKAQLDSIYSNALIVNKGGSNVGGLFGRTNGGTTSMNNCWFDGVLTNMADNTTGYGGILGKNQNSVLNMTNCFNSGVVSSATAAQPYVGGLIGNNTNSSNKLTMKYCLNTGKVVVSSAATGQYSAIFGTYSSNAYLAMEGVYATTESSKGGIHSSAKAFAEADLLGDGAKAKMATLFADTNVNAEGKAYWNTVPGKLPVLSTFADMQK